MMTSIDSVSVVIEDTYVDPLLPFELHCPRTVDVGDFFFCWSDMVTGSKIRAVLEMIDIATGVIDIKTNLIEVPEMWSDIPGGPVRYQTYGTQGTTLTNDLANHGIIMPVTHTQFMSNWTTIEIVALTSGRLTVDVRKISNHISNPLIFYTSSKLMSNLPMGSLYQ